MGAGEKGAIYGRAETATFSGSRCAMGSTLLIGKGSMTVFGMAVSFTSGIGKTLHAKADWCRAV